MVYIYDIPTTFLRESQILGHPVYLLRYVLASFTVAFSMGMPDNQMP